MIQYDLQSVRELLRPLHIIWNRLYTCSTFLLWKWIVLVEIVARRRWTNRKKTRLTKEDLPPTSFVRIQENRNPGYKSGRVSSLFFFFKLIREHTLNDNVREHTLNDNVTGILSSCFLLHDFFSLKKYKLPYFLREYTWRKLNNESAATLCLVSVWLLKNLIFH